MEYSWGVEALSRWLGGGNGGFNFLFIGAKQWLGAYKDDLGSPPYSDPRFRLTFNLIGNPGWLIVRRDGRAVPTGNSACHRAAPRATSDQLDQFKNALDARAEYGPTAARQGRLTWTFP